nr:MAG TPA: hypothetical protein [Caudoviricetes sp.]
MVRLMDLIDVHNTIDTMKFSSFVDDYMYDDAFHDMVEAAGITPLDFLEQKIGEALDPIRSLELDDYSKDYSHMVAAKDNLSMLLIDYYQAPALDEDNPEQDFAWAMDGWLEGLISDCDHDREINGIITQAYVIEDFKRDFFTACSKEEMDDNLYHRLSDFFYNKEPYLNLASIEGLFSEGVFDKLRDMNDDPYDYYDYQMSGALDGKYTGALSDDKAKSFNLEYYLDGLRSIAGDGNFSMQDLSCVYSRLSEAFHPIRDEILANKYDKSLDSLYSCLLYKMDETFVSVAGKVNKIKPHMLADWFEEELGTLRQEVDMIGLDMTGSHKDGYVTKRDDDALLLGMLCERYYDEHFAKMGFSSELKHYRPHIMDAFLDAPDVSFADKFAYYKKYRDAISVDEVYNLDARVGYKSWDNSFRMFRYSDASFSDYCSDYGVGETSLKDRRYLEDAAYAQGRGLTASLQKNIFAGLNGENAGLDKVETCIAKTVDIGEDFLANMNAVSGIVGYGIKKAFRAAGDDRGYGYLLSGAIANACQKHLTPEATVKYVQKCGVANIIYNSAWAGMHGEPIQVMKGLGYSRLMSTADVQRYDISDGLAEKVVNRFCKNKEAAQVFKNINDDTQDPFGGPQENQVRKELNVPVYDKNDDLEKSV